MVRTYEIPKGVTTLLRKFLIAGIGATALAFPAAALADGGGSGLPDPATLQANIAAQVNTQIAHVQQGGMVVSEASADAKAEGGDGGSADGGDANGGHANSGSNGGVAVAEGGDADQRASADGGNSRRGGRRHRVQGQRGGNSTAIASSEGGADGGTVATEATTSA